MIDNERYVTVLAQAQRPALVVADDPDIAKHLQLSIDLAGLDHRAPVWHSVSTFDIRSSDKYLERFAVVCLYDPSLLTVQQSANLKEHVLGGGGLLILLGHRLSVSEANSSLKEFYRASLRT